MYLQHGHGMGSAGLGACAVPRKVTVRKLVCTEADLAAIGAELGKGRALVIREVRTELEDAIRRAVVLIERAESVLRWPRATGEAGDGMRQRFRDAFGTSPEFVPTWRPVGQTWDVGAVVRERLRCAAKIMSEGDIEFVCWGPLSCPFAFAWTPLTWAVVEAGRFRICLGQRFWHAKREGDLEGMATTLLHECLHIYFDTIRHALERWPYNRAACYERYVLVANGLPVPHAVNAPCPSSAPVAAGARGAARAERLAGLGDPPKRLQPALQAIGAALALNPKGGYVKGSSARSQLDASFQSVDDCIALELAQFLLNSSENVARLFRHRLHRATQRTMLMVLARKAQACLRRAEEELRRREREEAQTRHDIDRRLCRSLVEEETLIAELCRRTGESSDACRTARSNLQQSREEVRAAGITCP